MTVLAAFVLALAMVETPHGVPDKPGAYGETGRWQLRPAVREDRTRDARKHGRNPVDDVELATEQVLWLQRQLRSKGIDATAFNIALAWNAGLGRMVAGNAPLASYDFALRVCAMAKENIELDLAEAGQREHP